MIGQKAGKLVVVPARRFHHEPLRSRYYLLFGRPDQQRREACQRVREGSFFTEGQVLAFIDMAEASHKGVFGNVNAHNLLKRGNRGGSNTHKQRGNK